MFTPHALKWRLLCALFPNSRRMRVIYNPAVDASANLSRSQSLGELIRIVVVIMILRPQLHCKGIMKLKPLKIFSCFAMMHSWICCSLSDKCRCHLASMSTPYIASCSVGMVSLRRQDFLSFCQSVCTPLLGLAEHSFDHIHGVVRLRLFNEAVWWSKEFRLMTMWRYLATSPTAPNLMLHACLLSATYVYIGLLVSSAFSFFLKKFFMASLVRLFRFFLYRSSAVMSENGKYHHIFI